MPRLPSVPKPSAAARAAGKFPGRGGVPGMFSDPRMHEFKAQETCPLCIEDLDATDMQFSPCPCGYRVCLFCYEQLKIHCNSQCPGCRREYGKEQDPLESKAMLEGGSGSDQTYHYSPSDSRSARPSMDNTHSPAPASSIPQTHGTPTSSTAPRAPAGKKGMVEPPPAKRSMDEVAASLPSGATWGTLPISMSRQQSVDSVGLGPIPGTAAPVPPAGAVDDTAWPSLGTANPAPPINPPPNQNGGPRQRTLDDHGHRRQPSMSMSTGSIEGVPSYSSLDQMAMEQRHEEQHQQQQQQQAAHHWHQHLQQQQQQQQQQLHQQQQQQQQQHESGGQVGTVPAHLADAFASAEVFSTVQGVRRPVNVPLDVNGTPVHPYSEAPALLVSMQQAVKSGTLSSKDAAARLLALLKTKERDSSSSVRPPQQSMLAAGRAPPGFSAPIASSNPSAPPPPIHVAPTPSLNHLNNLDNPIVPGPPQGRYNPISPPMGPYSNGGGGGMFGAGAIGSNVAGTSGHPPVESHRMYQPLLAQHHAQAQAPQSPHVIIQAPYNPLHQQQQHHRAGTYSVWSGLPGIDLSASSPFMSLWQGSSHGPVGNSSILGQPPPAGGVLGSGLQYGSNGSASSLGGGMGGGGEAPAQPMASRVPPPGFGPSSSGPPPGFGGHATSAAAGSLDGSQASSGLKSTTPPPGFSNTNGVYNPLQAQLGALRNNGVTAYRPQLGAL